MTADEVKKVTFEKVMRGYRVEDVDDFLMQVAAELERLNTALNTKEAATSREQEDTESKMYVLAQKVEEYRGMEETLKTALINAQRMGETVVKEARQKADAMVRDASGKAELLRQQAEEEIARERQTLEGLQAEVSRFKATVLNMYKQHIESLSALDVPVEEAAEYLNNTFPPYTEAPQAEAVPEAMMAPPEQPAPQAPEAAVAAGEETPLIPDNKQQAVIDAGIDPGPPSAEFNTSVNLFEGVPIPGEEPADTEQP